MTDDWADQITAHLLWLRSAGSPPGTLRLRRHYLQRLAAAVHPTGPWQVTADDIVGYLATAHWAPETRKSARAAARTFYRWAEDTGRVREDPARRLRAVRVPAGQPRPAPRAVVEDALRRADHRERVMLLLGAHAGLRCAEIAAVHSRDLTSEGLRVRGKGGVVRVIPLLPELAGELAALPKGYAFPGKISGHLSPAHVGKLLKRLLGPGWSAHTLRHAFASRAYAGTRDLRACQTLLGHSRPETTARYTLVSEASLVAAVQAAAG